MGWFNWTLTVVAVALAAHGYNVIGDLSSVEEKMQQEISAWN